MKTYFFIITLVLSGSFAEAQETRYVSGIVTAFRKIPLNNVMVLSEKLKEVTYTDTTGLFQIKSFNKDKLSISASGFVFKKFRIGKKNFYGIYLDYVDNVSNFNSAVSNGHISEDLLREAIFSRASRTLRDYSKYKSIYELIASEFYNLRVNGTSVENTKKRSMSQHHQVLYVVDDRIVPDISFVLPDDVKTVEFIDDYGASMFGISGANGVLKITLK